MQRLNETGGVSAQTSILSRLPKLSEVSAKFDYSARTTATAKNIFCANCDQNLKNESEFSQNIRLCRDCLKLHARLDSFINEAAERKSIEMRRQQFEENLKNRLGGIK